MNFHEAAICRSQRPAGRKNDARDGAGMRTTKRDCRFLVLVFSLNILGGGLRATAADGTGGGDATDSGIPSVLVEGARANVPSEALGDRGSPQSFVGDQVIHEIASPFGDFGTIANYTPSYESSSPNGPGFDAAKGRRCAASSMGSSTSPWTAFHSRTRIPSPIIPRRIFRWR
jgi:hypothetical protein